MCILRSRTLSSDTAREPMHQLWNPHLSEDGIGVDPEYQDKGEPVRASNIPCDLSSIVGLHEVGTNHPAA